MSNLEKLIATKAFTNDYHRGMVSLVFVGNWMVDRHQQFFKQYDITMQQFNILRILRGQHPKVASINSLKERMLDKMSDVSRLVQRLKKAGLIDTKSCEMDRRAVDVSITAKGLELLKTIDLELHTLEDNLKDTLNDGEIQQLNHLLDKILTNY
ncbi:MarR family transcriptional regulator [Chitinophaga caeni]|uniref:MarR family transcriptional regulator n=1 Tax=Chitinophaga caeni TaxID=2029983 RepID=A0A291QTW6_9BACT|nr:MarR family transcriptional regulator [Chitinophaga caeni]ATL47469.1 MarR family transcriptional regulator [Chitinophaga caeni]